MKKKRKLTVEEEIDFMLKELDKIHFSKTLLDD